MTINIKSANKELSMKEDERAVSRARILLSNDKYMGGVETGEPSFRVYYGGNGAAIPFMWESQPGTPKHHIFNQSNDDIIPPLSPPPSFSSSSFSSASCRRNRGPRIFSTLLSSITRRDCSHLTPTPTSSSSSYFSPLSWSTSSSGSSSSSLSSPHHNRRKKNRAEKRNPMLHSVTSVKKFPLFDNDEQVEVGGSPPRTSAVTCFGIKKQGCYYSKKSKNNFSSEL